jgi:WD40 repeat protein
MMQTPRSIIYLVAALLLIPETHGQAPTKGDGESQEPVQVETSNWITSIAQVGDRDLFVAATANGLLMQPAGVESFSADSPEARTLLYSHPAAVWAVSSTPNGETIASVDYRGNLATYQVANQEFKIYENALERWCQTLITEPSNALVIAGNEAGKILVWDLAQSNVSASVELDGNAITGLVISPDHQQLAASDGSGQVHLLKWPSLEIIGKSKISESPAWSIAYVPAGNQLIVGCGDNKLYRVENQPDAKAEVIATGNDWFTKLAVSVTGTIAAGEVSGELLLLSDSNSPSAMQKTFTSKSGVWSLYWNGDQELLVGTRKHNISKLGRSWDWVPETQDTEKENATDETTSGETTEAKPEETESPKAVEEKPQENVEAK